MRFLWATRGRRWGFRFLRDGGLADPLPVHLKALESLGGTREGLVRSDVGLALRFLDPLGREDHVGRQILHEFVIFEPKNLDVTTLDEARALVWPKVEEEYASLWDTDPTGEGWPENREC